MKRGLFILVLLFVVSCTPTEVPLEKQCTVDADCVPDKCCHAADTVNKAYAPECGGTFCTQDCQPDTLDCGQGKIKCLKGACTAVYS